jgi:hypothetical protein
MLYYIHIVAQEGISWALFKERGTEPAEFLRGQPLLTGREAAANGAR